MCTGINISVCIYIWRAADWSENCLSHANVPSTLSRASYACVRVCGKKVWLAFISACMYAWTYLHMYVTYKHIHIYSEFTWTSCSCSFSSLMRASAGANLLSSEDLTISRDSSLHIYVSQMSLFGTYQHGIFAFKKDLTISRDSSLQVCTYVFICAQRECQMIHAHAHTQIKKKQAYFKTLM
jgi:hypothetical protein